MFLFNPWTLAITIAILLSVLIIQQLRNRKLGAENNLLTKEKERLQRKHWKAVQKMNALPVFDASQTQTDFKFFERKAMEEIDQLINEAHRLSNEDNCEEAESKMQKALAIANEKLKKDHHHQVRVLTWLGYLANQRGDRLQANEYWERALVIASEWDGKCDKDVSYIEDHLRKNRDYLGF